ncbi:hypothetical protein NPIL_565421, partial [Nephila pilipes]
LREEVLQDKNLLGEPRSMNMNNPEIIPRFQENLATNPIINPASAKYSVNNSK